jgi:hypothetical protein
MNTASRELCQELYELSGWGSITEVPPLLKWSQLSSGAWLEVDRDTPHDGTSFPAYDLGYLLRKLPKLIALPDNGTGGFLFIDIKKYKSGIRWRAGYHDQMLVNADTPEDAVCSLAIELFKRGILTK